MRFRFSGCASRSARVAFGVARDGRAEPQPRAQNRNQLRPTVTGRTAASFVGPPTRSSRRGITEMDQWSASCHSTPATGATTSVSDTRSRRPSPKLCSFPRMETSMRSRRAKLVRIHPASTPRCRRQTYPWTRRIPTSARTAEPSPTTSRAPAPPRSGTRRRSGSRWPATPRSRLQRAPGHCSLRIGTQLSPRQRSRAFPIRSRRKATPGVP